MGRRPRWLVEPVNMAWERGGVKVGENGLHSSASIRSSPRIDSSSSRSPCWLWLYPGVTLAILEVCCEFREFL